MKVHTGIELDSAIDKQRYVANYLNNKRGDYFILNEQ